MTGIRGQATGESGGAFSDVARCCKSARNLTNCAECGDFPCDTCARWLDSHKGDKCQEAYRHLQRFKALRVAGKPEETNAVQYKEPSI